MWVFESNCCMETIYSRHSWFDPPLTFLTVKIGLVLKMKRMLSSSDLFPKQHFLKCSRTMVACFVFLFFLNNCVTDRSDSDGDWHNSEPSFLNLILWFQLQTSVREMFQPLFQCRLNTFAKWMRGQCHFRALTAWEILKIGINLMNTWQRNVMHKQWIDQRANNIQSKITDFILHRKEKFFYADYVVIYMKMSTSH